MSGAGILDEILLIGSWCAALYKEYFKRTDYNPVIKTRDIDFLLPNRPVFKKKVDLEKLLAPLGFEIEFFGRGWMKLENDELMLEFLFPQTGPSRDKPYPLPALKFNAQPLRHLAMLWRDPIGVNVSGIVVRLPHPADFCVHKLIISRRRKKGEKQEKDLRIALETLEALLENGDEETLHKAILDLTTKEKKELKLALDNSGYNKFVCP